MKQLFVAGLLCLFVNSSSAQDTTFYLFISDDSQIISFNNGVPVFSNSAINTIFGNYTVTRFNKAYPLSNYSILQKYYRVTSDSIGLAVELHNADSALFPEYRGIEHEEVLGFVPSERQQTNPPYMDYLDIINAEDAWDKSKGSPNIVIGVTDTYFDLTHEDMHNKYANVSANVLGSEPFHGTLVSGLIACNTNNGDTGYASIGFNCRLDVYADWAKFNNDSMMHIMSVIRKRGILNGSWGGARSLSDLPAIDLTKKQFDLPRVILYNEIYESGTFTVFSAGNGRVSPKPVDPRRFFVPASYDHNFSVSNIGYEGNLPNDTFNVKHVHEVNTGDSNYTHQHNTRVDLCAPAVRVGGLWYDPNSSKRYTHDEGWGTSFAAPMVAGAAGLLRSKMSWLTPYQLEYLLKKSSYNFYNISYNQKYAGATRWTGRIGAGTLDASAALDSLNVDSFIADRPEVSTFIVKGIKYNNKCQPGKYAGVPVPSIEVLLENGKAPYTYRWDEITGNDANISSTSGTGVNSISVTIPSLKSTALPPYTFQYYLSVYDASDIQKVANMVVKIEFLSDSTWDLAMQDAEADLYNEPNDMAKINRKNWDLWSSPDLWNRQTQDDSLHHQNPEYFQAAPNYLYTRIKNVGCAPSPYKPDSIQLYLYWTIASTGETWPMDWDNSTFLSGKNGAPGGPAGDAITPMGIDIPSLNPGEDTILHHNWYPPQPQQYDTLPNMDVCVLARIQHFPDTNYGMTYKEDTLTKRNVKNNNNIVTRNLVVTNLNTSNKPGNTHGVIIANGNSTPKTYTVQVITDQQIMPYLSGHLGSYLEMTLHLGGLYDKWTAGGRQGTVTSYDDEEKTVSWDLLEPVRLENITFDANESFWVYIEYHLKSGITIPYEINNLRVHLQQLTEENVDIDNGDGTTIQVTRDEIYGNVTYSFNIESTSGGAGKPGRTNNIEDLNIHDNWFEVYPNPVNGRLTLTVNESENTVYKVSVTDISGKIVLSDDNAVFTNGKYSFNTSTLVAGAYFVTIRDNTGKDHAMKFVKVE